MRILFSNTVLDFFVGAGGLNSPSNGGVVNQCVFCAEFLSVEGFTALVEVC